jgi:catechol-2,3-dioxygenase
VGKKRPEVAIGHIVMHVSNVGKTSEFYLKLGLRSVSLEPGMSILELLGGTHLMVIDDEEMKQVLPESRIGAGGDFELMVGGQSRADIESYRDRLISKGLKPRAIDEGPYGHYVFKIKDPDKQTITVYSSHATGPV